jgi:phage tail protein X
MATVDAPPLPLSAPEKVKPPEEAPPANEEREEQVISAEWGDSIFSLALKHYGALNKTLADLILEANPGIINIDRILSGQKIKIPVISDESLIVQAPERGYRIHLGTFAGRRAVRIFKKEPGLNGKNFEFIKKNVSPRQDWYKILVGTFESREECLKVIRALKAKRLLPAFRS